MVDPTSFVTVSRIFFDYPETLSWLARLSGKKPTTHSVLRNVSFHLKAGQWATLYGAAGSGKSTLLRSLAGAIQPRRGLIRVNGRPAGQEPHSAAGLVTQDVIPSSDDTVTQALHAFGDTHNITQLPARIGAITEALGLTPFLYRPVQSLSTTERIRLSLAKAALSDAPITLLDDVPDHLGVIETLTILKQLFDQRTVIISTRSVAVAEKLSLPLLILSRGRIVNAGTPEEVASTIPIPRVIDVWLEGLRYDLFLALKKQPGVTEARLLPDGRFSGQRIRITVRSTRHLPAVYDLISQAAVVRVQELPVALQDILARL